MSDSIRAFLAFELPDEAKKDLAGLLHQVANARINGLRSVKPNNVHITLKFLGNVEADQIASITGAVAQVSKGIRPFVVKMGGVGVYPSSKNARVLWVGLDGDVNALRDVQSRIDGGLERVGVERESRRFSPHLTIARIRDRTSPTDRLRATEALFSAEFNPGPSFQVETVSLIRSDLLPEGPNYTPLAHIPLGASNGT